MRPVGSNELKGMQRDNLGPSSKTTTEVPGVRSLLSPLPKCGGRKDAASLLEALWTSSFVDDLARKYQLSSQIGLYIYLWP